MSTGLSPALAGYPLTDMTADFREFAATHQILPPTFATTLDEALVRLLQTAAHHTVRDLKTLLNNHRLVLCTLTGAASLTARLAPGLRAEIHLHRNILLTVALGAAHTARIDTTAIPEAVITLTRRTQQTSRPFCDDEILLLRTHATIGLTTRRTAQAATVYTLCDAGEELREATQVGPTDFDDPAYPTMVNALGHHRLRARILPLEDFHTAALARRISTMHPTDPDGTIAYNPRTNHPGSAAAMVSAHGMVDRLMGAVGLRQPDVAPSSVRRWRIAHTYATQGIDAAAEIAGHDVDTTLRLIARPGRHAANEPEQARVKRF